MRQPRVRFSIRWMLAAVAIVALSLGCVVERRQRFRRIAHEYDLINGPPAYYTGRITPRRVGWYDLMHRKYEYAARYPWLPVAPNPRLPPLPPNDDASPFDQPPTRPTP